MKKLILVLSLSLAGVASAEAQDASAVIASFAGGPQLSGAVYDELMTNPSSAAGYCQAADNAGYNAKVAVGAAFAQAYEAYRSSGDDISAAQIAQVACTCEATAGQIAVSFASQLGGTQAEVCSASWDGEWVTPPGLLRTSAGGGGGDPVSPN